MDKQRYIGDGVTATVRDGVLTLSTERESGTHYVVLEPQVWAELEVFVRVLREEVTRG